MTPPLHEFLVIVPDNPSVPLSHRLSVRDAHLTTMVHRFRASQVAWGGAILQDADVELTKPTGSAMLYLAENVEQVRGWVENDVYATQGIWDVSKAQYLPFRSAKPPAA